MDSSQNQTHALAPAELSNLIGDIYEAAYSGDWEKPLHKLLESTKSNKAFICLFDRRSTLPPIVAFKFNFEYDPKVVLDYFSRPFDDPYRTIPSLTAEGTVTNCNDHINIQDYADTEYYRSILAPMRSMKAIGAVALRDDCYEGVLVVNRGNDDPSYEVETVQLIETLIPHLKRAFNIYLAFTELKSSAEIANTILEKFNTPYLVVDNNLIVLKGNIEGRKIFEHIISKNSINNTSFGLTLEPEKLIRSCVSKTLNCKNTQTTLNNGDLKTGDYTLNISKIPLNLVSNNELALITIKLEKSYDTDKFSKEFELSKKEDRLLKGLISRKKLGELTNEYNVTYNTLRTQLQSIFKKVGIKSQVELFHTLNNYIK